MEADYGLRRGIGECISVPIRSRRQRVGRSNPRLGLGAARGGDSTACRPVKSPDQAQRGGQWGFDRL